ncbi:hypothetical protein B0H34DRAFT_721266 [Crassisporium funariophilum]|nr:hypothetical protein B0H34DRAFT_721266 [Crassisporium funariophilum]
MIIIAVLCILSSYQITDALPVRSNIVAGFSSEILRRDAGDNCNLRSIWDIIWSCLATLFACTWITIHPNLPAPSDGKLTLFARRLGVTAFALVAPEVLFVLAARQWFAASEIAKKHREKRQWTKTHGFFLIMGGFMLHENGCEPRPLDMRELEHLERENKVDWPSISEEEIEDKSKGDFLSKGIVVAQVFWFMVQCIGRGASGLVVTELEIMTLAFAAMNGVMYSLWWNKPLDVRCAVAIHMKSPTVAPVPETLSMLEIKDDTIMDAPGGVGSHQAKSEVETTETSTLPATTLSSSDPSTPTAHEESQEKVSANLTEPSGTQTMLPTQAYQPVSTIPQGPDWRRLTTFYSPTTEADDDATTYLAALAIASVFGAIHCIAWSFAFPSTAERLTWRICSAFIAAFPVSFIIPLTLLCCAACCGLQDDGISDSLLESSVGVVYIALIGLSSIVYVIARLCLLILPLLALRALPDGAYLDLSWSSVFPHI